MNNHFITIRLCDYFFSVVAGGLYCLDMGLVCGVTCFIGPNNSD